MQQFQTHLKLKADSFDQAFEGKKTFARHKYGRWLKALPNHTDPSSSRGLTYHMPTVNAALKEEIAKMHAFSQVSYTSYYALASDLKKLTRTP